MTTQVKFAETETEKEAIYRLRYQIYIEDVGSQYSHSGERVTDSSDDTARLLIALDGDEPVGSMRINWGGDAPFGPGLEEIYKLSHFSSVVSDDQIVIFDRFVVKARYRGTHVPFQLMAAVSMFSLENRVQLAFCTCQPHLLNLYLGLGFRTYAPTVDYGPVGIVVPLVLVCEDQEHLRRIGSPMLALTKGYTFDSDVPAKVEPLIAHSQKAIESASEEAVAQWIESYGLLSQTGTTPVAMFEDLSEEDVAKILAKSHIIDCKAGHRIILQGKGDRTIFVILAGTVEIRSGDRVTAVLTEGDVVGELAFLLHVPRTADVVAVTDGVRVLSLREKTVRQLQKTEPALAAQLMYNLARIVGFKMVSVYQRTSA
jgi:predicted GNAT family N-acyltransferase